MRKNRIAIAISILFSVLFGCRENPVKVLDDDIGFNAKVINANNDPVADVGFQYIFFLGSNVVSRNYQFRYALQATDTVTMAIFDPFGYQIATPLNNAPQRAGNYVYNYDATSLPNGVYSCVVAGSTINQKISFFVLTDDIAQLAVIQPLTRTSGNGVIQLSYASLGIGNHFLYQNGSALLDLTIADSIVILLTRQGYKNYLQGIKLDTTKSFNETFTLEYN